MTATAWSEHELVEVDSRDEVRISALRDVTFVDIDESDEIEDRIDHAYASKYRNYAKNIVDHINGAEARAATIRLVPR